MRRTKKKFIYGSTQLNEVNYVYSSTGSLLDDDASRVTSVLVGATTVAEYRYLGQGHLVDTDLAQPDVFSRVHNGAAVGTAPGTGGTTARMPTNRAPGVRAPDGGSISATGLRGNVARGG